MSAKSASGVEELFIASASVGIPTAAERLEESITNSVSNTQECTGVVSGVVIEILTDDGNKFFRLVFHLKCKIPLRTT